MAEGRRCCRDSVAMKVIASDETEREGVVVPCRWCEGFGRYESGRWIYHDAVGDFVARETTPDAQAYRAKRMAEDRAWHAKGKKEPT